ncbi:hypothetical protein Rsub_09601 [Raphidocelis subcapitata]|uniref:FAS1 domain-containing protein n=1 Tax=Raphidocelis subcapitata TaxID=307507 RepID=A0A2V0PK73_9CHLO|nr:hypothetical protein Rsub_09601 [Raphidocelis subcapitata]|eukprot:GBF97435.1 hypothetical protein Rsub_09601 [Raphidocelis subcapitata]
MASARLVLMLFLAGIVAPALAAPAPALTTCQAVAKALNVSVTGTTVFCPTNEAFAEFAEDLGLKGPKAVDQLLALAKANPATFKTVLSYHVTKGVVPASALKDGATIATLLPKETLKVAVDGKDVELVHPEVDIDGDDADDKDADDHGDDHGDEIVSVDQTFEGPYRPSFSTYIVHGIDHVMVPKSAATAVQKLRAGVLSTAKAPAATVGRRLLA